MSKRKLLDSWSRAAKKLNYPSRSIFKLQHMDKKRNLFRKGNRVLDLGCAPGSWSLFAAKRVGKSGSVLALDINLDSCQKVKFPSHVTLREQDVLDWDFASDVSPYIL